MIVTTGWIQVGAVALSALFVVLAFLWFVDGVKYMRFLAKSTVKLKRISQNKARYPPNRERQKNGKLYKR
jgi:hypothetical protein